MTRRPKAGGGTRKEPGRQGVKVKRKISTTHPKHPAPASRDLRELLKRRTAELTVAREQQIATADVLKVIASSPGEVGSALQAVVESACKLCNAYDANVVLKIGDDLHYSAHHGPIPTGREPRPLSREWVTGRSVIDRMPVQVSDFRAPRAAEFPEGQRQSREQGHRCTLSVPLLRESEAIGAIVLRRLEPVAFTDKQIKLLQIFADQAVIAIENVRLFNEMQEALERQTATADILKVIASSPSDVKPVFEAIAARAKSLVGGFSSTVFRFIDGVAHLEAFTPTSPDADDILRSTFPRPAKDFAPFRMTQAGEVMQIPDTEALTDEILGIWRARGFRSMVFAPLMNKGVSIGFIAVTRIQPGDFSDHHVQLLRTFADQAVIAIQNVRLFDEVRHVRSTFRKHWSNRPLRRKSSASFRAPPAISPPCSTRCSVRRCSSAAQILASSIPMMARLSIQPLPMRFPQRMTNSAASSRWSMVRARHWFVSFRANRLSRSPISSSQKPTEAANPIATRWSI